MDRRAFLASASYLSLPADDSAASMTFDGTKAGQAVRALNGVNGGPLAAGGLFDLSARWKEAAFPLARLHDSHWPNPDVVDVHAVFPNSDADPARPESYDFERTDDYVKANHDCGSRYDVLGLDSKRDWGRVGAGRSDACEASIELPARSIRLLKLQRE